MAEGTSTDTGDSPIERARVRLFGSVRSQQNLRLVGFVVILIVLAGGAWAAYYAYDRGFTKRWRRTIINELGKHGLETTIGRLTIDPVEGLVARDVFLYDDPKQKRLLAKINRISLDIDLARLMQNENFLSKIDFKNADLSLPLEPEQPKGGDTLNIRNFSAHILMENNRIEITRASGLLAGMEFNVRGSLLGYEASGDVSGIQVRERMDALKQRRSLAWAIAQTIKRFQFRGPPPRLDVEVTGDLARPSMMRGNVALTGTRIGHRDYLIDNLKAAIELNRGEVVLQYLILNDDEGELHLSGSHGFGSDAVNFHIDSSAAIHKLLRAGNPQYQFTDIEFHASPHITARGEWYVRSPDADDDTGYPSENGRVFQLPFQLPLPWRAIGTISCDDFTAKGARMGFSTDFNLDRDRLYLRDAIVEDGDSGSLSADVLFTPEESRYQARLRMDPGFFGRFLPADPRSDTLRHWLDTFEFTDDSSIQAELTGHRSNADDDVDEWEHGAEIDLRDFSVSGREIDRLETEVSANSDRIEFKEVRVERGGASAFEPRATWSFKDRKLTLTSLTSALDPVSTLAMFSPNLAAEIGDYRFEQAPNIQLKGVIAPDSVRDCDFSAVITSRGGMTTGALGGEAQTVNDVTGNLQLQEGTLTLNLTGKTAPGTIVHGFTMAEPAPVAFAGRFPLVVRSGGTGASGEAENVEAQRSDDPSAGAFKLALEAPTGVSYQLAGIDFPLPDFTGELLSEAQRVQFNGTAHPFDGKLEVSVGVPNSDLPGYRATVNADGIDFGKLAQRIAPDFETKGKLRVLCSFSGVADSAQSIDGSGSLHLTEGNIFAIPMLGPLSPVVSKLYKQRPVGYAVAREATADYRIRSGQVITENFTSSTGAFTLSGAGSIDFTHDRVDLNASLRARRAVGVLLYPVNQLFKFSAQGTMSDPGWRWLGRSRATGQ